jgi:hypothetical protein
VTDCARDHAGAVRDLIAEHYFSTYITHKYKFLRLRVHEARIEGRHRGLVGVGGGRLLRRRGDVVAVVGGLDRDRDDLLAVLGQLNGIFTVLRDVETRLLHVRCVVRSRAL